MYCTWDSVTFTLPLSGLVTFPVGARLIIRGAFVPRILARYRTRVGSMISITNLETASVVERLRQRHPTLDWGPA